MSTMFGEIESGLSELWSVGLFSWIGVINWTRRSSTRCRGPPQRRGRLQYHRHELIPPQNCAIAAPRAKHVLQLAASAERMVMRLAVFLIPGLALAGLALAVRRHRLAARQRAASVHQGADVLKWRSRRRAPNVKAAVQQDGNVHKNVDPAPLATTPKNVELAPVVTLPQQRTPPMDAAAVPKFEAA